MVALDGINAKPLADTIKAQPIAIALEHLFEILPIIKNLLNKY